MFQNKGSCCICPINFKPLFPIKAFGQSQIVHHSTQIQQFAIAPKSIPLTEQIAKQKRPYTVVAQESGRYGGNHLGCLCANGTVWNGMIN
jgi:hypothetical protein